MQKFKYRKAKAMNKTVKILALLFAVLIAMTALTSCDLLTDEYGNLTLNNLFPDGLFANPNEDVTLNVTVLNGTTGFGAAALMSDAASGKTELDYNFTVETDASNVTAGLINGSIDIAALPTNAAAALYNKTNGKIKIAAVNTLGVLYLMTNSQNMTVNSISDLDGKTVYCPAQNPAFIFKAICDANGVDVTIDTAYSQPADLRSALVSGKVDIAVLPEPMVTIAKSANENLTVSLDLTEEWESVYGENTLMQGCIVVRTEWAVAHPKELNKFLEEYEASVNYTTENPSDAAELIVSMGVFAGKSAVAAKAIPNCHIVYIDGYEMACALDVFFETLYDINPQAVGGKIPDSEIYLEK